MLYAFDTCSQVDCVSGGIFGKLRVHMSSGWDQSCCCSLPDHGPTLSHQMSQGTIYGPTGDSNREPLAYCSRTQTTELKGHMHRRPVKISICLIRFISESTRNQAGADETAPLLPAVQTWTHTEPQNGKGEEKLPIIFTPAEDRTRDPLHAHPNLYRAAIKAGLYRKALLVCYIPNTTTYSGIHLGWLPPYVASSFQICKIWFSSYGEVV